MVAVGGVAACAPGPVARDDARHPTVRSATKIEIVDLRSSGILARMVAIHRIHVENRGHEGQ